MTNHILMLANTPSSLDYEEGLKRCLGKDYKARVWELPSTNKISNSKTKQNVNILAMSTSVRMVLQTWKWDLSWLIALSFFLCNLSSESKPKLGCYFGIILKSCAVIVFQITFTYLWAFKCYYWLMLALPFLWRYPSSLAEVFSHSIFTTLDMQSALKENTVWND